MKSIVLVVAAFCILAAAGFTSFSTPYSTPYATPIVERPSKADAGSFEGLLDLANALPAASTVRVLWTHGMCTHPPTWIDDRMKRLVEAVGGTAETVRSRPVGRHGASLRTDRISTGRTTIEVLFLTWSPLTAPYKAALDYDRSALDGRQGSYTRATLNRELKNGLINDCLTDVVVYAGPNGNDIREAMNEAVCDALGGRFGDGNCDVSAGDPPAALALVTESLGSKLLFDAVLHTWNAAKNDMDRTRIDRLAASLAATRSMYMLANQVPLLDVGGATAADQTLEPVTPPRLRTSAGDVFSLLSRARARSPAPAVAGPMTVVAFSDPNDLLSYRIVPAHLGEDLTGFRIVNVLVSNDTTYFGYVERPDTAHCGYPWNPYVIGMMARGYQAGKPLPSVSGLSGGTCPSYIWTPVAGRR